MAVLPMEMGSVSLQTYATYALVLQFQIVTSVTSAWVQIGEGHKWVHTKTLIEPNTGAGTVRTVSNSRAGSSAAIDKSRSDRKGQQGAVGCRGANTNMNITVLHISSSGKCNDTSCVMKYYVSISGPKSLLLQSKGLRKMAHRKFTVLIYTFSGLHNGK
ncbi:hypothetical protein XELAEV_18002340mg [Xenopus laevis]|nr:hypothetical protein XELAEV_18002340mg [Xenopus laevis]